MIGAKQTALVVGVFVVAMASGVILGIGVSRKSAAVATTETLATAPAPGGDPRARFASELGLSAEQQKGIDAIWDGIHAAGQKQDEMRRDMDKKRDADIEKLFSVQQKAEYDAILEQYNKDRAQMRAEREGAVHSAEEKIKALLTEGQRAKYEEMLKNRPPRGGPGRRGGPESGPASREGRGVEQQSRPAAASQPGK